MKKEKIRVPSLRGIERSKLKHAVQTVNVVLGKIVTTATNDLIYAGSVIVNEMVGVKRKENYTSKQPWWKRRLEQQVTDLNRDLGRVNAMIQGKKIKQQHTNDLQNRFKTKKKGLGVAREEIKQRIAAYSARAANEYEGDSEAEYKLRRKNKDVRLGRKRPCMGSL